MRSPATILAALIKAHPGIVDESKGVNLIALAQDLLSQGEEIQASLKRAGKQRRRILRDHLNTAELALHSMDCSNDTCQESTRESFAHEVKRLANKLSPGQSH